MGQELSRIVSFSAVARNSLPISTVRHAVVWPQSNKVPSPHVLIFCQIQGVPLNYFLTHCLRNAWRVLEGGKDRSRGSVLYLGREDIDMSALGQCRVRGCPQCSAPEQRGPSTFLMRSSTDTLSIRQLLGSQTSILTNMNEHSQVRKMFERAVPEKENCFCQAKKSGPKPENSVRAKVFATHG